MSTLSKLEPSVRADRAWRRNTVRRLHRTSALLTGNKALVIRLLAHSLDQLRKASNITGAAKQRVFLDRVPGAIT